MRKNALLDAHRLDVCIPFGLADNVGFALPAVHADNSPYYVISEIDEITERVKGFRLVAEVPIVFPLSTPKKVGVGDEPIYAFLNDDGVAYAGTKLEIEQTLRFYLARNPEDIAIALQYAEMCGSKREKRNARLRMRSVIFKQSGPRAALAFYEGSVLRSALWSRLLAAASSYESGRRILDARSRLSAYMRPDGSVSLDISAIDPSDYANTTIETMADELKEEFEYIIEDRSYDDRSISSTHQNILDNTTRELLSLLSRVGRQEERVTIILDAVLADRTVGMAVLERHRPRAKFEEMILEHAKNQLKNLVPTNEHDMVIIQKITERALRQAFPIDRSYAFLFFAKHLGKYPQINNAIRAQLSATSSYYVRRAQQQIIDMLDAAAGSWKNVAGNEPA